MESNRQCHEGKDIASTKLEGLAVPGLTETDKSDPAATRPTLFADPFQLFHSLHLHLFAVSKRTLPDFDQHQEPPQPRSRDASAS